MPVICWDSQSVVWGSTVFQVVGRAIIEESNTFESTSTVYMLNIITGTWYLSLTHIGLAVTNCAVVLVVP